MMYEVQYIRCAKSDFGCYNVTEPPIDAPRDPMYKSEREISKVEGPFPFFCHFTLLITITSGISQFSIYFLRHVMKNQ